MHVVCWVYVNNLVPIEGTAIGAVDLRGQLSGVQGLVEHGTFLYGNSR